MSGSFLIRLFSIVINMSVTASAAILFVLLARLLLKKAPKLFSYALWAVVLFRLLCPVSVATDFSLLGLLDAPVTETVPHITAAAYLPQDAVSPAGQEAASPVSGADQTGGGASSPDSEAEAAADPLDPAALTALAWLTGIGIMAACSAVSLLRLRRRLVGAVPLRDNIHLADHIDTPFVMGILRPKIYLPSSLSGREQEYILLHERRHIRRGDHIVKALAFAALCLHWFNPLVWLAFALSSRDMEMSCDEAVVKELGEDIRAEYSASLLRLATGRRIIALAPLAFGEGDTKGRIRNLLSRKPPKRWLTIAAVALSVTVIAACAGNPQNAPSGQSGRYASMEAFAQETMDGKKTVDYYRTDGSRATANVTGTKLVRLEKQDQVEGLAPEGTLEAWSFHYLVQTDAEPGQFALLEGMYGEDGWYDLEGQGGHDLVALRYPDCSYDILHDAPVNGGTSFYGCHSSYGEAVYDWYVAEHGLDLPLYVKELAGDGMEAVPAHRYDGDRWYLYIPVSAWWRVMPDEDPYRCHWEWTSGYGTGSTLAVDWYTQPVEEDYTASESQGFSPTDSTKRVWVRDQNETHERCYIYPGAESGSLRVWTYWTDAGVTDDPHIVTEPDVLRLMAESFTVDARIKGGQGATEETVTVYENGEIAITVPARYASLIKVDDFGSDNLHSVKANLYYAPGYIERDLYTPPQNGGWMLTVSTTSPDTAANVVGEPSQELICGCWTADGVLVYVEIRPAGGAYNCDDAHLEEFKEVLASIRVDYGELTPFEGSSSASATPLTKEELAWFNDWLEPIAADGRGNADLNPLCCFLTSCYGTVTELDFAEFMRYFPGGSQAGEAEFEALRDTEGWPFGYVNSLEEMPVPVHKYPKRLVDEVLGEYAGISTADLDTEGVAYLPEYGAYYNYTSDAGFGTFTCTRGERDGDLVRLYDESQGVRLLTLRRVSDTAYQIVSHRLLESAPA